ncbi:DNA-binding MurR/RpiR family transcriptional regulator [Solibacillus kalamii]|uniref:Transcriptional regulator n=1 Tax=Solibacillus kalamii TaxID=1748298 RepID=A0ABX3ZH09_9BACL|nr:MurR/RpiR family transcriptional regulator [Solibacillus kalamii]MBM7665684.1 DNA-binding MurR/RpiR family transcriptional regulator [Solibacillus kalamii]OUZ38989.1 transcriptional regulator [Solibacillus kalamii]
MENSIERIRSGMELLKPAERNVALYILSHLEDVIRMPIAVLAEKAKTSEATIVRMCRALNFSGFKDLKLSIATAPTLEIQNNHNFELEKDSTIMQMIQTIEMHNIDAIQRTLMINGERELEKIIHQINNARKIIFIGIGASAIVAQDFEHKLKRINKNCETIFDSHGQLIAAAHATSEDVVFAISYSGETKEVINALTVAKENKATIITMTQNKRNTIQSFADSALYVVSNEADIRSSATASRIAQLTLIDILYTGIATLNYDKSIIALNRTLEVIKGFSR